MAFDGPTPGWARRGAASLARAKWLVATALAAIAGLAWLGGLDWPVIGLAMGAVLVAAAVGPGEREAERVSGGAAAPASTGLRAYPAEYIAAAIPDPMAMIDQAGAIVYVNDAARAAFGDFRAGTLIQLRFRTPEFQTFLSGLRDGAAEPHVTDYAERVPIERWFRIVGRPIGHGTNLFVLVFKDQSETRRIDRMRSDFIANASHELRTPLASVAGFIETLRGPARNDAKARDHFLQIMQDQTARMARLIDDLLSLSRLEMKTYAAPSKAVDLHQVIDRVVNAMSQLAAEVGVTIVKQIPTAPVEILGQPDELIQVFENLVENACKYGQSGGKVLVLLDAGKGEAAAGPSVTVRDFGPGIPEEHIPRLTERFYRIDAETSRAQKGTGLGLAIVKHILTRYDARLTIRSWPGEGAAFTVQFPAR
ncbi:PAS domain-containing protein [Nitratireductor sp. CAU 1489]|uniref:histidine kinase n=1 Tax=Nitratireductor arenosus TaxID=2682096 RepID=A0A844QHB0_9HYPH|nr:ATP-binding protein [Nitratireductor arenosus]MVA98537.1 PAS domain-containing protein [Nitratireductor arenosus]